MADGTNSNKKIIKQDSGISASIDSFKAAEIARKFFEQYNSGVEIKNMELKNNVWTIVVGVDFLFEQIRQIKIDASTGRVLEYT
ncbi:MAG: hypothetical protein EPO62_02390 [Candidatus Nitrosotenuis sp.]|nr:MAG: hypothetical protein EPO62_02390 [Candidatus Nitrosotenuis sp.]